VTVPDITRRDLVAGAITALPLPAFAGRETVAPALRLPIRTPDGTPIGGNVAALTLDACSGRFDERIARALVENEIRATIFVTGIWMRWNPAGLAFLLAHRHLFDLQNHGARHIPAVVGGGTIFGLPCAGDLDDVRREVQQGAAAIQAATGAAPRWYRGASARYSPSAIRAIEELGFAVAGYSLSADLGASLPAGAVTARIAGAAPGDVIIGHINHPERPSGAGIVAGVLALRRRGMDFELLTSRSAV